MKRFIILVMAVLLMNDLTKLSAQTPITVTVPPMGEKVKLHPLKTGSYEIGFVLSDNVNQITAPGILYVDNKEGVGLKVGISVVLFPEKTKVNVTSMNTIQGWMVVDGDKYVTYEMNKGDTKADIGYCTVWGYSKKYQALKIQAGGKNATVIYDPKSYKKIDDVTILEKIFEIADRPGAIDMTP